MEQPCSFIKSLAVMGAVFSIGCPLYAGTVPIQTDPSTGTLASVVEQALDRNEWVLSFVARVQERQFAADQSRRWQNPELNFSAGRKEVSSSDGSTIEASLAQPFFFPGKLGLRAEIAGSDTELSKLNRTKAEIALRHDVIRLAYQYAMSRQKIEFVRQRRERFELVRSYLAGRPFASPQKKAERHLVENRLRELMAENLEIETSLKNSLEKLKLYLDEQTAMNVVVPWLKGENNLERSQWEVNGFQGNPDLAAQRLALKRAQQELELTKKEKWPDFSLSAFYRRETAIETERALGIGLAMPLPVLNLNSAAIRSLGKRREAEEHQLRFQEREFQSHLLQALNECDQAGKIVSMYSPSLGSQLQEQIKEAEAAFRRGQLDLLFFLELDSQTAETYYRMLNAQSAFADKLTDLFALMGESDLSIQLEKF
jgi:outer membrane protein TolC